ncbi:MAG: PAS domain-containing protein [Blastocatellales bacterium]
MRLSNRFLQTLTVALTWTAKYGLVVVVSGLALLIVLVLDQTFGGSPPIILFIVPVVVSAWYGGLRSGLLATLLSSLGYNYFLQEPRGSLLVPGVTEWVRLSLFLAIGGLVSWLIETTHAARRRAETDARAAERWGEELTVQIAERKRANAERERLIEEIATERALLRALVEDMPIAVLMVEAPSGRIVVANPQMEQLVGHPVISPQNFESYRDWVAYHPNGQPFQSHEYPMERALRGEAVQNEEILYERGDGSWKGWLRISLAPVRDASGEIIGVVALGTDIDEEKQAREALRQSQERLSLAQKAARIGHFEWNVQTNLNIWSEEVEALYGMPPGSFGGSYEAWAERVHPEDLSRAEADVQRALIDGEYRSEWRVIWPDDSLHWLQAQGKVYYDEAGQPLRLFGINMDVTERRRADEELRASEQRLGIALAAAQMGSWHRDCRTNEITCTAACKANFGRSPDSAFTYNDLFETIHPDDQARVRAAVQQAVQNHEEYQAEYRVIWPDGNLRWISVRGHVTYGSDGQPLYLDGVTLDVTERKLLEESLRLQTESLREADRRKDEFLATLAHELRNPLAPIRNAIEILAKRGDDPAVVTRASEVMERQVQQMVRLLEDLLEVSRIGRGKISLQKAPVDLTEVVAAAVETSRPLVEAHRHKLTVSLSERPVCIEADAARLAQALTNLLNNAAKYTEDGGRIDLTAERVNGEAVLRVRDNGIGIAPEMLPQVFDMFAQVESATDRSHGGLGIGLTLVRRLIELHGGKIEAHSAGLGKGSEFLVRLPALAESQAAPVRKPAKDISAQAANGSRRILIVDDNIDSAESLAMLLQLDGHEVHIAHDGLAALEEAHAFQPDVMLLDINLPEMDGYEVARRLRREAAMKGMTLVAMTGYGQEEDRQRTLEAGFQLHLVKPVDLDMLHELLPSLPANQSDKERERGVGAFY